MKTILTVNDVYAISDFLFDNGYADVPLTITVDVLTRERLNKINEDLFYQTNPGKENEKPEVIDADEVVVTVHNFKFKFVLKENDSEDQEQTTD